MIKEEEMQAREWAMLEEVPHEPEHPRDEEDDHGLIKAAFQTAESEYEEHLHHNHSYSKATPLAEDALVAKDCYCCSRKTKQSYADHESMKPAVCADCAGI